MSDRLAKKSPSERHNRPPRQNAQASRKLLGRPAFQRVRELNRADDKIRLAKEKYPPMIKSSMRAGMWTNLFFFLVIAPFVVNFEPRPLWRGLLDTVLILMVYDFFYYLTHRFLFHASHDSRFAVGR